MENHQQQIDAIEKQVEAIFAKIMQLGTITNVSSPPSAQDLYHLRMLFPSRAEYESLRREVGKLAGRAVVWGVASQRAEEVSNDQILRLKSLVGVLTDRVDLLEGNVSVQGRDSSLAGLPANNKNTVETAGSLSNFQTKYFRVVLKVGSREGSSDPPDSQQERATVARKYFCRF